MSSHVTQIIPHPGTAHPDEFLGTCIAIYMTGCTNVERRKATREDLENPAVMVIDHGGEYNPSNRNFDHHQDPVNLPCSLHLVAEYFNLTDKLRLAVKGYDMTDAEDRTGVIGIAEKHRLPMALALELRSNPIGDAILDMFSRQQGPVAPELVSVMKGIAENMLERARQYEPEYGRLEREAKIAEVDGIKYLTDTKPSSVAREDYARANGVAVIVSPNKRGSGYQFKRLDNHPRIDLAALAGHPDFDTGNYPESHVDSRGFFAATTHPGADIRGIVSASVVKEQSISKTVTLAEGALANGTIVRGVRGLS